MKEAPPRSTFIVDSSDFLRITAEIDERLLKEAFIGLWPNRNAFGQHLLNDNNATESLEHVPRWLRPYVSLDGAAFVDDLVKQGVYVVTDVSRGVCVFDGPIIHNSRK